MKVTFLETIPLKFPIALPTLTCCPNLNVKVSLALIFDHVIVLSEGLNTPLWLISVIPVIGLLLISYKGLAIVKFLVVLPLVRVTF